jgi:predicted nucleic acid-binding OB-fold protein
LPELQDKYPLANIDVLDSELYDWAKQKAKELGYKTVSELIFDLILLLNENPSIESKLFKLTLLRQLSKVKLPEVIEELEEKITDLLKNEGQKRLSDFEDEPRRDE